MEEGFDNKELEMILPYDDLYNSMLHELDLNSASNTDRTILGKKSLIILRRFLTELKHLFSADNFETKWQEIKFFKEIKPKFYSHWIFWIELNKIEVRRPVGHKEVIQEYLNEQLQKLSNFFFSHIDFYQYYRSGATFMDEIYFLREGLDTNLGNDYYLIDVDRSFSTSHDFLVSKILANEMISVYLNKPLLQLQEKDKVSNAQKTNLSWTGPKVGFAELIYAFHASGVINNSQIDIKQLSEKLSSCFNIEISNVYKKFEEIRMRKKNRTVFLDALRLNLLRKMDEDDEHAL